MSASTIRWYDVRGEAFAADTEGLELGALYDRFLPRLPRGGRILDAGCGSGRDTLAFLRAGYEVVAFDGSRRMVEHARGLTGGDVRHLSFDVIPFRAEFDGVWACASLLHVPGRGIDATLGRLVAALRPGGVLYVSFKYGAAEEVREGRLFSDYDEVSLGALFARQGMSGAPEIWVSGDSRPGHVGERWINGLLHRDVREAQDTGP